jgi:large subunit ribosomal protein L24
MSTAKLQTGDAVLVIAGKYKKSTGTITSVYVKVKNGKSHKRVVVSGLPATTRYQRSAKHAGYAGQMMSGQRSIDISNVALATSEGKPTRVKITTTDGKKIRTMVKGNTAVVYKRVERKAAAPELVTESTKQARKEALTAPKKSKKETK